MEQTVSPPQQNKATRKEWIGLAVIALPCLLYSMDLTVLNLAIPQISEDLRPTSSELLWIIDIYGFMVAGMLITMGTLGDRIGRRKLLLIGAAFFGASSLAAAFSTTPGLLILNRAILGIAGATVAPSTLSLIRNMFHDEQQRTFAIGVWITAYSVGGAIGPLVGGTLLQYFHWGSVFIANVPIMLLLLLIAPKFLPEYKDPEAGRIDLLSAALSLSAILLVILGLKLIAQDGFSVPPVVAAIGGIVLGGLFIQRQKKIQSPLVDLNLFRGSSAFGTLLSLNTLSVFTTFGCYIFISQYLQLVLGLTPLVAGLWTLPWTLGFIVGSMLAPKLATRFKKTTIIAGGLMLAAFGFVVLAYVGEYGLTAIVTSSIFFSFGLAPLFTLITDMMLSAVPPERAGSAGALSETSSEMGGALGIAVLGSIGTAIYRFRVKDQLPAGLNAEDADAAINTIGGATSVAAKFSPPLSGQITTVTQSAFVASIEIMAIVSAVLATVLAAIMLFRFRGK